MHGHCPLAEEEQAQLYGWPGAAAKGHRADQWLRKQRMCVQGGMSRWSMEP